MVNGLHLCWAFYLSTKRLFHQFMHTNASRAAIAESLYIHKPSSTALMLLTSLTFTRSLVDLCGWNRYEKCERHRGAGPADLYQPLKWTGYQCDSVVLTTPSLNPTSIHGRFWPQTCSLLNLMPSQKQRLFSEFVLHLHSERSMPLVSICCFITWQTLSCTCTDERFTCTVTSNQPSSLLANSSY